LSISNVIMICAPLSRTLRGDDVIGQGRQLHEEKTPKSGQESSQIGILERWLGWAMRNDLTDSVKSLRIEITALQETPEELRSLVSGPDEGDRHAEPAGELTRHRLVRLTGELFPVRTGVRQPSVDHGQLPYLLMNNTGG
jgi:hypothetical protein